jgi:hypothetical protein
MNRQASDFDSAARLHGGRYYGKYRGVVIDNRDPEGRGRLRVQADEIRGSAVVEWALPAVPYAGSGVGLFAMPPVGANVWLEYEAGDLRYPIWSGCFWAKGDLSTADAVPEVLLLKTSTASIRIDERSGEMVVEASGAKITLKPGEILIDAPQVNTRAGAGQTRLSSAGFDAQSGALKVI